MSTEYSLEFTNNTYQNNTNIETVDLGYLPWKNNSMNRAFQNCSNLTSVTNINENINDMIQAFYGCSNLVNAPEIPNSVVNMQGTFSGCFNLVSMPEIPNSVTDISWCFEGCTFNKSYDIPNSVINMKSTFNYCYNLTGDINIHSENITNAQECFTNTSLDKNVYIPFMYENGVNTLTYNAFIEAGYSTTTRKDGALLMDINSEDIDLSDYEYNVSENNDVTLTKYIGTNSVVITPHL